MGEKIRTFGDIESENHKFHKRKNPLLIYDVDINKFVVFTKILVKEVLNILLAAKMLKELDNYT